MTNKHQDDLELDGIISELRSQQFADQPPTDVQRHVLRLNKGNVVVATNQHSMVGFAIHALQATVLAMVLCIGLNVGWSLATRNRTQVGHIHDRKTQIRHVMYADGHTEVTEHAPEG